MGFVPDSRDPREDALLAIGLDHQLALAGGIPAEGVARRIIPEEHVGPGDDVGALVPVVTLADLGATVGAGVGGIVSAKEIG